MLTEETAKELIKALNRFSDTVQDSLIDAGELADALNRHSVALDNSNDTD